MVMEGGTKEVSLFMEQAKSLMSKGRYDFMPRRKNMQSLAQHGLTIQDAKDEIFALAKEDYYKGPKQDFDHPGMIWEFKKNIEGTTFYIKVKIIQENGENLLRCLSFHEDEFA